MVAALWLKKINNIIQLEKITNCLKSSIITPIYKENGKEPLLKGNYRGISLTSVIAKMLEYALLERIKPVITDSGHPHFLQSAYQQGISCQDAIFATQEALLRMEERPFYPCLT